MSWVTIYSLEVLLPQFGTSPLFHIQLLLDLHTVSQETGISISLRIFQLVVIHRIRSLVNEVEVDVFLEFPCFFYDPADAGNLISYSSAFSKSSCTPESSWLIYC